MTLEEFAKEHGALSARERTIAGIAAAAEREACAKIADEYAVANVVAMQATAACIAAAIRERVSK